MGNVHITPKLRLIYTSFLSDHTKKIKAPLMGLGRHTAPARRICGSDPCQVLSKLHFKPPSLRTVKMPSPGYLSLAKFSRICVPGMLLRCAAHEAIKCIRQSRCGAVTLLARCQYECMRQPDSWCFGQRASLARFCDEE